jgi:hypothetical protein
MSSIDRPKYWGKYRKNKGIDKSKPEVFVHKPKPVKKAEAKMKFSQFDCEKCAYFAHIDRLEAPICMAANNGNLEAWNDVALSAEYIQEDGSYPTGTKDFYRDHLSNIQEHNRSVRKLGGCTDYKPE